MSATFVYDGDGNRVKSIIGTTNTVYIGGYFEWSGSSSTMRRYYYAGGQRIAMRLGTTTLRFLLGDHLGSTAITATSSGSKLAELRYYPWGGVRYSYGTTPTDYRFTGQQEIVTIGLYFYNSRFYDASLGRFVSPDSIIPNPGDPVSFDRFAYVRNNPLKYVDPSGHNPKCGPDGVLCDNDKSNEGDFWGMMESGFVPTPTPVDEKKLDDYQGTTGISGKDFYQWYLDLFNNRSGWWWEMFGQDSDGLTIWDAIAVIMIQEAWMNWSNEYISEAMIRAANNWCSTTGGCTIEGYINWFAHYSSTAGNHVSNHTMPNDPRNLKRWNVKAEDAMRGMAAIFQEHPPSWNQGCAYDRPCGWANSSLYLIEVQEHLQANQTALFTYNPNFLAGNPWLIPSGCVYTNWLDKNNRDLSFICDPVR